MWLCVVSLLFSFSFTHSVVLRCTYEYVHVGVEDVDRMSLMKVMAILQQCDSRDGHIYVAATGDVPTLKRCLEKHPEEVMHVTFIINECTITYIYYMYTCTCTCMYKIIVTLHSL